MRNIKTNLLPLLLLAVMMTACASLYTSTVTITQVVDAGMKDWAAMSKAKKTTPAVDAAVIKAHDQYRAACAVTQKALLAYNETGDDSDYVKSLAAVREAAMGILDLITPFLTENKAQELNTNLSKATHL